MAKSGKKAGFTITLKKTRVKSRGGRPTKIIESLKLNKKKIRKESKEFLKDYLSNGR